MPIMVKAVSKDDFAKWLKKAKEEYASADGRPVTVADAHAPRR
jgi:heme/copper-type cytochrome/quinol oxidase subunit 2